MFRKGFLGCGNGMGGLVQFYAWEICMVLLGFGLLGKLIFIGINWFCTSRSSVTQSGENFRI